MLSALTSFFTKLLCGLTGHGEYIYSTRASEKHGKARVVCVECSHSRNHEYDYGYRN